jgi:hypothetical protein
VGGQIRWHSLVSCNHGDSSSSRFRLTKVSASAPGCHTTAKATTDGWMCQRALHTHAACLARQVTTARAAGGGRQRSGDPSKLHTHIHAGGRTHIVPLCGSSAPSGCGESDGCAVAPPTHISPALRLLAKCRGRQAHVTRVIPSQTAATPMDKDRGGRRRAPGPALARCTCRRATQPSAGCRPGPRRRARRRPAPPRPRSSATAGCTAPVGAGGDHGIDHHQNWLRFTYVCILFSRSHDLPPHPYAQSSSVRPKLRVRARLIRGQRQPDLVAERAHCPLRAPPCVHEQ